MKIDNHDFDLNDIVDELNETTALEDLDSLNKVLSFNNYLTNFKNKDIKNNIGENV